MLCVGDLRATSRSENSYVAKCWKMGSRAQLKGRLSKGYRMNPALIESAAKDKTPSKRHWSGPVLYYLCFHPMNQAFCL